MDAIKAYLFLGYLLEDASKSWCRLKKSNFFFWGSVNWFFSNQRMSSEWGFNGQHLRDCR